MCVESTIKQHVANGKPRGKFVLKLNTGEVIKMAGLLEFCCQVLRKPTCQMIPFALSFLQKNIAQHICSSFV